MGKGKELVSIEVGGPEFVELARFPTRTVKSDPVQHFTDELEKNESEQESISGLTSNNILIRNVTINSVQPLHFRLEFYARDSFTDEDLDEDTFIGSVDLDIPGYGKIA